MEQQLLCWMEDDIAKNGDLVGGKNASLAEMITQLKSGGVRVPDGFIITATAYREFIKANELNDYIRHQLQLLKQNEQDLKESGKNIRKAILKADFDEKLKDEILKFYKAFEEKNEQNNLPVAVRSSATAEDLPGASFAGQLETYLNISGEDDLLESVKKCFASLFTDRAISYRENKGFDHMKVALSVGIQKMVRSDQSSAGVMFSLDTDTGFPNTVVINGIWGLGENIVQGVVTPDEFTVFKPFLEKDEINPILSRTLGDKEQKMVYAKGGEHTKNVGTSKKEKTSLVLNDDEILELALWAKKIEDHYQTPMDMEWAKDGKDGKLFIVQARPETVHSQKQKTVFKQYHLKDDGEIALKGLAVGEAIASGKVMVIDSPDDSDRFEEGAILVTGQTDPDWVPIMKMASGIITDFGGRTSHAAIVSRELGLPAIVGAADATSKLKENDEVTISCAEGSEGKVYEGKLDFEIKERSLDELPEIETTLMVNLATPSSALRWWKLPVKGVGLARMEFIINNYIKAHPLALANFDTLEDKTAQKEIKKLIGEQNPQDYFINRLAEGISMIAASRYPDPVIVRLSDFKTNEYATLLGGKNFETEEENPMMGFRGASRYYSEEYKEGFSLECQALLHARNVKGFNNIIPMIPFCRTPDEADLVLETMAQNGLVKGKNGLQVYVMVEVPSNIFLAEDFAKRFDGFSIGSNDLTQLILGVDRDSQKLKNLFDERNPAIKQAISHVIKVAKSNQVKIGICGQAPSDYPEFTEFLVREGIDTISLNPDSVFEIIDHIAQLEQQRSK